MLALDGGADEPSEAMDSDDPFVQMLLETDPGEHYEPVAVDQDLLLAMRKQDVFVITSATGAGHDYYKNMMPELDIVLCESCGHFFHGEEWEFAVLNTGKCPFCRVEQDIDSATAS